MDSVVRVCGDAAFQPEPGLLALRGFVALLHFNQNPEPISGLVVLPRFNQSPGYLD
ncbi:hypothetical protein XENTR_v10003649 [Xenopus tropicalis]|nr:hypothetical protein XENTR_v10003649 [Xenopus tropicalis]